MTIFRALRRRFRRPATGIVVCELCGAFGPERELIRLQVPALNPYATYSVSSYRCRRCHEVERRAEKLDRILRRRNFE